MEMMVLGLWKRAYNFWKSGVKSYRKWEPQRSEIESEMRFLMKRYLDLVAPLTRRWMEMEGTAWQVR
jgi:hypothetical protein